MNAPPKVELILPMGGTVEATQDHIIIHVVPGVPDGYVTEQKAVCTKNAIRTGPHFPTLLYHATSPTVPRKLYASQEELTGHVLQACIC